MRHDVRHPARPRRATAALLLAVLGAASGVTACGGDTTAPATTLTPTAGVLAAVSGSGQIGIVNSALAAPLVVKVTSATGTAIAGATVAFVVTSGTATLAPATATTDATGQATTQVTLGATAGSVVVAATVQGTALSASFTVTAQAITQTSGGCTAVTATLAVGQATTPTGTTLCVAGGTSGAEYALLPFNGATSGAARASVTVTPNGIVAAAAPLTDVATSGAATLATAPRTGAAAFEARLRATSRAELTPRLASARAWYAARRSGTGARLAVIPATATVGSLVSLNANANSACSRASYRAGRIMAITSKAIVVADTLNPSGGYTSADYQSIATTFDTLVDAVDTRNFGQPSDIDGNGHVILFFTSAVNALTPRNADYYIGGFFYNRDLFPTTGTSALAACAASNVAEMFYLLVPDPTGTINGNKFSKTFVTSAAIGTTAHEYQHLINASRRLYVNTAAEDFEETWLDEGLAHVAEELLFYARSGLTPRRNLDATTIRGTTATRDAFNSDESANFARFEEYLTAPAANSPYADDDSLATRGATWAFLRYAADRQSAAEATVWQQLVNSTTTGLANLRQVFGSDVTSLVRDWTTSLLLDDVGGAEARYLEPSWNYRSMFGGLRTDGTYPLQTTSLTDGVARTVTVAGGSAAYLRFGVAAGSIGSVTWGSLPTGVQLTLVRLR